MKKQRLIQSVFTILLTAFLCLPTARARAETSPELPNFTGAWRGFFRAIGKPDIMAVDVEVTAQLDGLVTGSMFIGGESGSGQGSLAGVGIGEQTGTGSVGLFIIMHSVSYTTLEADATVEWPDGTRQEGPIVLVRHCIGNPDLSPPRVEGNWRGTFSSLLHEGFRGDISAVFDHQDGPDFSGSVEISSIEKPFRVIGSVSSEGVFTLIGMSDVATLIIESLPGGLQSDADEAKQIGAQYQINISGDGGGEWFIDVSDSGLVQLERCPRCP